MKGWTAVEHNIIIDYDLENSPLQIRTNSEVGSNKKVLVYFYAADGDYLDGVGLYFGSTPQYWLFFCTTSYTDFPTPLPSETDKIWTITLIRTVSIKLKINCNNKEVINIVMSDITCDVSDWRPRWSRDVEKIKFSDQDKASDYYRPGK